MKQVLVYGPGCKRCETLAALVTEVATAADLAVRVEKVTDARAIAQAGVLSTPGLAIDGRLVHAGGLPDRAAVRRWLDGG